MQFNLDEGQAKAVLVNKAGAELRKKALAAVVRNTGPTELKYDTIIDGRVEVKGGSFPAGIEAVIGTNGELYALHKGLAKLYDTTAYGEDEAVAKAANLGIAITSKAQADAAIKLLQEINGEVSLEFLGWFSSKGHIQAFRFPEGTKEVRMFKKSWNQEQSNTGEDVIVFNLITGESYMIDDKAIKAEWYSVSNFGLAGKLLMASIPRLTAEDMEAMAVKVAVTV
jgi:hypothetical protein